MNIGGVERSFLSLLSTFPKDKYDITLLLLEKKGGFLQDIPDWIKVKEVEWFEEVKPIIMQPPQKTIRNYFKNKSYSKAVSFTCSYIFSQKLLKDRYMYYQHIFKFVPDQQGTYDIAISYHGPTDVIDYYIANKVTAKRKITWVHFDVSKHLINKKLYKRLYQSYNKVYVVSKEAKYKLVQKIPSIADKSEVFMNTVSKELIETMSKEKIEFGENYEGFKIVTVGRLAKEKGQDLAIQVLARLRKEGYQVRWYCVGEGNQREAYEQLIKAYKLNNDFILVGSTSNPYPYIARADIYVQPSRHEGYCLTLAEARVLNKPIIATDFTGAREQIIDGYNGLIADISVKGLYEKISLLLEAQKDRNSLINNLLKVKIDPIKETTKLMNYIG